MQKPVESGAPDFAAPSFYLTGRQPLRPGVVLLAILTAVGGLSLLLYAQVHSGHGLLSSGAGSSSSASDADDDDDPSQIDTIVLGDPADAPVPGRHGNHVSSVHPTIIVRLPRYGDQVGLIPDSPAGHLLYGWLAAFNQSNAAALGRALPSLAPDSAIAAQMELRRRTGGYNLLSAKEVQPGVLVFRLRDQTLEGVEALGTLQVRPDSSPAAIASFSLRVIPPTRAPSK